MTIKSALCITLADAPQQITQQFASGQAAYIPMGEQLRDAFFSMRTQLADRAVCETDNSLLQLLPYIVLTNTAGQIFSYSRGGAGAEARLHGLLSIGLGGHVDEAPGAGQSLLALLQAEGARELQEEANVQALQPLSFVAVLADPTNPVGLVHCGILAFYKISDSQELQLEPGMIEKGSWLTLNELADPDTLTRLEPWSQLVVQNLVKEQTLVQNHAVTF